MIEINGDNVKTVVNSGGTVDNITIGANKAVINGNGTVKNVNVTANAKFGVEVLTVPTKVTVDVNAGAVKTKNGTIQPGTTATTSNPVSGGLSGGSGGYYTPSVPTAPTEPTTPSTDADLSDEIKDMLGLDKTTDDTDGDGLKDLFEFSYLTTDLLLVDTDGNGISDADEDFDIDGLSNIREEEIGTRPDIPDTDSDGLNDGEEVDNYGTDPLKADTDGDGLTDSEEIKLGLDPNAKKTDGITPDGERRFEQSASDFVKDDGLLNSDNWLVPSVSGNVPGDISRNILLEQSSNDAFDDNHAVLSDVIDVSTSYETIPLTLSFAYSEAYTGDVKSLTIVSFGEDGLKLIDTTVNEDNGALLGEITGNGTFFVIDLDEFLKGLGIDVFANTSANTSPMSFSGISSSLSFETDREDSQTELQPKEESDVKPIEYDYVYDNAGNIVDEKPRDDDATAISTDGADEEIPAQSHSSLSSADLETIETTTPSAIEISSATFDTTTFKAMADGAVGKAEIAFVLDVTGSMDDDIRNVANNIIAFVDALTSNYNVDASFALITYNDYYVPINGKYGTRIHRNNSLNWFASASAFKNEVNRTANEDCGFGGTEVFADGLGMAITELGWGGDASKFVVLLTDESGSLQNRYGYASRDQIADVLLENGICTSVITENSLQSSYRVFWETTGGLYANIKSDFSNVLLELADKVGEVTNAGGEWVFLDDFQAVKLGDALANAATNDTDGDGLTDAQELGARAIVDMLPYISALTNRYSVPVENYTGQTTLTVWKHSSNPVLLDTDYDGISDGYMDYDGTTVTRDPSAKNNSFIGKLYWTEDGQARQSQQDIEFVVDYRMLFKNNGEYKKDLAVLTSLYASVVYDNTYLTVVNADGTSGGSNTATKLERLFGLKDVEDIKINGSDYGVDVDDSTEFVIGHRTVTYKGISRDAIVVVVRGTNGTNAEWSSNFDVGADTSEYYAATGTSHPDWNNKSNHKGFDVAENRILTKINDYLARHSLAGGGSKAILITGHSRGAAIANLLGAHYENASNYVSYTYTFAAPNPTTSSDAGSYKTIFNIVNKDDIIPYLPLSNWGFKKYGVVKEISVQAHYENHWGGAQKGTWEWLTGRDYNNDGGTQRTLDAFAKIANSRSQIYVLDSGSDGTVWENNAGHLTRDGQDKEYNELTETLRNEKLLKYCKISRTTNLLPPYHVEVNYSPAYLMQSLANMTTGVGPLLGHDVKGKYREAKASFVASSGKVVIGGMTHPHLPITYYLIAYNNFVDKV
jgi:hypothetical protein